MTTVDLCSGVSIGGDTLAVVAGPCAIESAELTFEAAELVDAMRRRLDLPIVFKASFDKANRSSIESFRGVGLEPGLEILRRVGEQFGMPLLTDVHEPSQCAAAAEVCDILQIPAFLCRQTDLLVAAGQTGRSINIKKGQFMAPEDMIRAVDKVRKAGSDRVTVTERGTSFGYHNLVVDMRSFAMMGEDGIHVFFDATHSLQLPGALGDSTGGLRQYAEPLARAAIAAGASGVYLETHPRPDEALSDSTTQLDPGRAEELLGELMAVRAVVQKAAAEQGTLETV